MFLSLEVCDSFFVCVCLIVIVRIFLLLSQQMSRPIQLYANLYVRRLFQQTACLFLLFSAEAHH